MRVQARNLTSQVVRRQSCAFASGTQLEKLFKVRDV
jgi:hypothetical protein